MSLVDELAVYDRMMRNARDGQNINARYNEFRNSIRSRYHHLNAEDAGWLLDRLSACELNCENNGFIRAVLECVERLPDAFFEPLVRAAIYDTNPSTNRSFVEPAVRAFGFERVAERLLRYLSDGSNFEKGGAVNAFYWARIAARDDQDTYTDLRQRIRDKYLMEFVSNEDTQVRRCIIPSLDAEPSAYSAAVRELLAVAVDIARNHSDDYIRHRIDVQLGKERLLQPLPDRTR